MSLILICLLRRAASMAGPLLRLWRTAPLGFPLRPTPHLTPWSRRHPAPPSRPSPVPSTLQGSSAAPPVAARPLPWVPSKPLPRPCAWVIRPHAAAPPAWPSPGRALPSRCPAAAASDLLIGHCVHEQDPRLKMMVFTSLPLSFNYSSFNHPISDSNRSSCVRFVSSCSTQQCKYLLYDSFIHLLI